MELLDAFVNYFSPKCDDETKMHIFGEVFPIDMDVPTERLHFLSKITSLAIYLGHIPLLEIIALWLKVSHLLFVASSQLFQGNVDVYPNQVVVYLIMYCHVPFK